MSIMVKMKHHMTARTT